MAWIDLLRPASFRGVPFLVEPVPQPVTRGRRLDVHEYPGRDLGYAQDRGRRLREITYEAFVVGATALAQAKKLVDACENKAESGTLIDPWRGEMTVACRECTDAYDPGLTSVVKLRLIFVETSPPTYPAATKNLAGGVDEAAAAAKTAALNDFVSKFSFDGVAGFVAESAQQLLGEAGTAMGETLGGQIASSSSSAIWARAMAQFAVDAADVIHDPASLAQRVYGLMDMGNVSGIGALAQFPLTIRGVVQSLSDGGTSTQIATSWASYLPMVGWTPARPRVPVNTSSRVQEAANQAALVGLVQQTAGIEAARTVVRNAEESAATSAASAAATLATSSADATDADPVFVSRDDVLAARDSLADSIDTLQQTSGDETFRALRVVRAQVIQALTSLAPSLPQLTTLTPSVTSPAITIAFDAFGDDPQDAVTKAEDLVQRNLVPHPLFVSADPMQVLAA